ncbi:hypothetical protein Q9189_004252 [Teloschistes chrysophthalmus]
MTFRISLKTEPEIRFTPPRRGIRQIRSHSCAEGFSCESAVVCTQFWLAKKQSKLLTGCGEYFLPLLVTHVLRVFLPWDKLEWPVSGNSEWRDDTQVDFVVPHDDLFCFSQICYEYESIEGDVVVINIDDNQPRPPAYGDARVENISG